MSPANDDLQQNLRRCRSRVESLQHALYTQPDPAARPDLLQQLGDAQAKLEELEHLASTPTGTVPDAARPTPPYGRFLGPETTGLRVISTVNMQPVPTGIYHLLDPETDPLVTVAVENVGRENKTRRVCVKAYLEGLSAEAVRTVELKRHEPPTVLKLLPTLLPERARALTEIQRATLHVLVTDLDNKPVGSSRVDLQACKLEYSIVSPK